MFLFKKLWVSEKIQNGHQEFWKFLSALSVRPIHMVITRMNYNILGVIATTMAVKLKSVYKLFHMSGQGSTNHCNYVPETTCIACRTRWGQGRAVCRTLHKVILSMLCYFHNWLQQCICQHMLTGLDRLLLSSLASFSDSCPENPSLELTPLLNGLVSLLVSCMNPSTSGYSGIFFSRRKFNWRTQANVYVPNSFNGDCVRCSLGIVTSIWIRSKKTRKRKSLWQY